MLRIEAGPSPRPPAMCRRASMRRGPPLLPGRCRTSSRTGQHGFLTVRVGASCTQTSRQAVSSTLLVRRPALTAPAAGPREPAPVPAALLGPAACSLSIFAGRAARRDQSAGKRPGNGVVHVRGRSRVVRGIHCCWCLHRCRRRCCRHRSQAPMACCRGAARASRRARPAHLLQRAAPAACRC